MPIDTGPSVIDSSFPIENPDHNKIDLSNPKVRRVLSLISRVNGVSPGLEDSSSHTLTPEIKPVLHILGYNSTRWQLWQEARSLVLVNDPEPEGVRLFIRRLRRAIAAPPKISPNPITPS